MDRRSAMSKMYSDDVNAFIGLDHSHMGFWVSGNEQGFPEAQEEYLRQMCEYLNLKPGDRVLDVGGGQAATAIWLATNHDVEVVVVDIVDEMVEAGRLRVEAAGLSDRISCFVGDFLSFELEATFDAVIAVESIYHMPELEKVFKSFNHFLRTDGRFVVSTYVSEMRQGWLKDQYLMLTVGDDGIPSEASYRRAVQAEGLTLDDVEDVSTQVLPGSTKRLRSEPYVSRLREYHTIHFGRIVTSLLPAFFILHDWVMRRQGLRVLFIKGHT